MKKLLKSVGLPFLIGLLAALTVLLLKPEFGGISEKSRNRLIEQSSRVFNFTGQVSYSDAVKRAAPAVVSISTNSLSQRGDSNLPLPQRTNARNTPEGSGVIVDPEGYILTNHHVIQNAAKLMITLRDGREVKASIIGADPESDLAVFKVDLKDLPYLDLVDSASAEIGDVVLAIGNPFGTGADGDHGHYQRHRSQRPAVKHL